MTDKAFVLTELVSPVCDEFHFHDTVPEFEPVVKAIAANTTNLFGEANVGRALCTRLESLIC